MGTLKLSNSSGNFVALEPPSSIASDVTLTLPNTDGDASQFLQTNGSGALTWATPTDTNTGLTWLTHSSLGSSSSVTVTLPDANSNYILVGILGSSVSTTATEPVAIRVGNGSIETSGYAYGVSQGTNLKQEDNGDRFNLMPETVSAAGNEFTGTVTMIKTGGGWIMSSALGGTDGSAYSGVGGCLYNATGSIDRVQILTNTGTFDSGQIKVGYA